MGFFVVNHLLSDLISSFPIISFYLASDEKVMKSPAALIFGSSGVIGGSIATKFGQEGWAVGVHYLHNAPSAAATATTIQQAGGSATLYQADVTNHGQISDLLQSFHQTHHRLDVLIWAVGTSHSQLVLKTTPENWNVTIGTNLTGAFHVFQHVGPIFEQQNDGALIVVGSLSGEQGKEGQAAYAASKAGLIGLMRSTAREWGGFNVRVNAVFPGWHSSPLAGPKFGSALQNHSHLLNRTPSLDHLASTVFYLAGAKDISGQVWNLDNRIW